LVALVSKDAVAQGLSAGAIIREAAPVVGGGGGGRDDMAQAGGRDPSKLDEALASARATVERELG
jgi:alanyl-tRNA synthetase